MSRAFKCNYCKKTFEGEPANSLSVPGWLNRETTFQRGEDSWHVWADALVVEVNGETADLCRDCYDTVMLTYYKMLLASTQTKGSNDV